MNRNALLALVMVYAFSSMPVRAQADSPPDDSFTAQALKDACAPAATQDQDARALADQTCRSYLRGLTEGLFLQTFVQDSGASTCLPKEGPLSVAVAKENFLNYLAANPDAADHEAGLAAVLAIVRAHACEE